MKKITRRSVLRLSGLAAASLALTSGWDLNIQAKLPGRRFCRRWQPLFRLAAAEARQQLFLCILGGGSLRRGSGFQ